MKYHKAIKLTGVIKAMALSTKVSYYRWLSTMMRLMHVKTCDMLSVNDRNGNLS